MFAICTVMPEGVLNVSVFSPYPLTNSGTLLNLTFTAADGVPVTSPEQLAEVIRTHAVGEKVPLTVFGQGKYRQVTVVLRQAPDPRAAPKAPPAHPAELPTLGDAAPPTQARPKADALDRRR